jgi:multiple sugar transport system substrate-binding protein
MCGQVVFSGNQVRSIIRRHRRSLQISLIALLVVQIIFLLSWLLRWPQPRLAGLLQDPPIVELSMVVSEDEVQIWQALAQGFTQKNPNITIQLASEADSTNERESIYKDDFNSSDDENAHHDLVFMDVVWIEPFLDNLVDLSRFIKQDKLNLALFLQSEIDIAKRGDRLYRMPMYPDVGLLYYREDLLKTAGLSLPSTLDSLTSAVEVLKRSSVIDTGYLWQGDAYEGLVVNFFEVLQGLGGQWIENGEVKLTEATAIEAALVFKSLVDRQVSPEIVQSYDEQKTLESFLQGKTAFLRGWPAFWPKIQNSSLKGKFAIAPPFSFSGSPGIGCRGGWGLGISKQSAHPQEAWKAIKYFTSADAQKQFVLASGLLPSRTALFQDAEIVAKYPLMPQILEYLETSSAFRPAIKPYGEVSKILQDSLQDVLWEGHSAQQAMSEAQQKTQAELEALN